MEKNWGRAVALALALAWQIAFVPLLVWKVGDSFTTFTRILGFLVFLGIPAIAGVLHQSKRVMIAAMLLPAFLFVGLNLVLMAVMGNGR
jgi:hypothetical protein